MDTEQPAAPPPQPKPFPLLVIILFVLTVLLSSSTAYLGYQNMQLRKQITSFTNTVPSPIPTPIPSVQPDWKTYTNMKYNFSFKYPNDWEVKSTKENFNFVIGPANELLTYKTKIDEQKVIYLMMSGPGQTTLSTSEWKRGGYDVQETPSQINNLSVLLRIFTKNNTYQKEAEFTLPNSQYNAAFEIYNRLLEITFDQILSTFKFLGQTSPAPTCMPRPACLDSSPRCLIAESADMCPYSCPANGWVDCMPGPDKNTRACSTEAMAWYRANCPNFQGGAY